MAKQPKASKAKSGDKAKHSELSAQVGVDERKAEVAQKAGVNPQSVAEVRLDIDRMRQHGLLLDLDIHGLSMLRGRVSWSELGIPEGDVRRKRITRGSKDLFPGYTRRFDSLAARFRQTLDKHSRILEGFRPYRWMPYTQYDAFGQVWRDLQTEWEQLKAEFLDCYDEFVIQNSTDLVQMAYEAWDALMARYKSQTGKKRATVLLFADRHFENVQDFADYVAQTYSKLPSKDELEAGLYVDYRTAFVLGGSDLEAEHARSAKLQAERAQADAKRAEAEGEGEQVRQAVWKAQQLSEAEVAAARREIEMHMEYEQRKLQAMHEAEVERARAQIAQTVSPIQEYLDQVMADMYQDLRGIIASVEKNGHIRGNVAEQGRGLLNLYKLWAVPGVAENVGLEAALADLQSLLAERPAAERGDKYNAEAVLNQLHSLSQMTHEAASEVARRASMPTRAGALEL